MYHYYVRGENGQEYGPSTVEELREWVQENRVGLGTPVRLDEEGTEWKVWEKFPELLALLEQVQNQKTTTDLVPAPLALRLGGYCADMIFMSLPVGFALSYMLGQWNMEPEDFIRLVMAPGPMTPLQAWVETVAVVLQVLYAGYFIGRHGRTPGQRLFRLEVVDGNGQLVGWGQAWLRAVAGTISQAVMMLGYIIAPFLPQKRTWHDFVARTYVVRRY